MSLPGPAEVDRLILDSALQANVLPLTSRCDSRCVFCSHKNNPTGIAVAFVGHRSMAEITRTLAFLDPRRVITIGESATPIVEGEPLTHPDFAEIVRLVRRAFPDTPLEITTNGRLLTGELVELLEAAGSVSLHVSLNSASVRGRLLLMGDTEEESRQTLTAVRLLGRSSIRFDGSLVAMPNLVGWEDVRGTVRFLAGHGAEAVRVIVPAYSEWADRGLFPDDNRIFAEVREFVCEMSAVSPCPVLIEPSCVSDLEPAASGVVRGSPAWAAGVRPGDVLVEIAGKRPFSRVDAWKLLFPAGSIQVLIARAGVPLEASWANPSEGASGITMEYDFDEERAENVRALVASAGGRSLLLTSELGHGAVRAVMQSRGLGDEVAEAVAVTNRTFGGTIRASGLLTVEDYLAAYAAWRTSGRGELAQVLVPLESFSALGLDLKRRHFSELAEATGLPVILA